MINAFNNVYPKETTDSSSSPTIPTIPPLTIVQSDRLVVPSSTTLTASSINPILSTGQLPSSSSSSQFFLKIPCHKAGLACDT